MSHYGVTSCSLPQGLEKRFLQHASQRRDLPASHGNEEASCFVPGQEAALHPLNGKTTPTHAGNLKQNNNKYTVSPANTKVELKLPATLHHIRPQAWIMRSLSSPVKHSPLQQEHQAGIGNTPFDWNYTKSKCCKVTASLHAADSNYY